MIEERNDEIEIDLRELFFVLLGKIWIIILATALGLGVAAGYTTAFMDPVYSSTSLLYVMTKSTSITSLTDLQVGSSLTLPYYITSPILMGLLKQADLFSSLTVMVQAEVGERMAAAPGSKAYGYLSVSVQYFAEPQVVLSVPPHAFLPQPKVSSAVVRLEALNGPAAPCRDADFLFAVSKAAFLQRRKTLANALAGYAPLGVSREQAEAALAELGLDARIRGERLSLREFAALSDILRDKTRLNDK